LTLNLLADNSVAGQTKLSTSSSPEEEGGDATKITEISSSKDDDLDNDNENISVTGSGSPDISCVSESETNGDGKLETGAFTSIIQKNRKSEFMSQFPVNSHFAGATNPMINHALAAHLFFQNPLLPPPNQWLYNQLYNNYHDFPWLRHTLAANTLATSAENSTSNTRNEGSSSSAASGLSFIKRSITLLTNNSSMSEKENDSDVQSSSSPPVTSTKRSPSPAEMPLESISNKRKRSSSSESVSKENVVTEMTRKTENFMNRSRIGAGVKHNDVWRPY
jgi:hypothetical protein